MIAIVVAGPGGAAMSDALDRLDVHRRRPVARRAGGRAARRWPTAIAEELLPVLEILPLQQLAWRLALDRGGDPDRPRGLAKVTSTW